METRRTRTYDVCTADGRPVAKVALVSDWLGRLRGLMGRTFLAPGTGLWLDPCNGVHTFRMRFAVDAVMLDKDLRILRIATNIRPNRIVWPVHKGHSTLELPAGTAARASLGPGDRLQFTPADQP